MFVFFIYIELDFYILGERPRGVVWGNQEIEKGRKGGREEGRKGGKETGD